MTSLSFHDFSDINEESKNIIRFNVKNAKTYMRSDFKNMVSETLDKKILIAVCKKNVDGNVNVFFFVIRIKFLLDLENCLGTKEHFVELNEEVRIQYCY